MAYVVPTASDFKTRFPAFAAVDNNLITLLIGEMSGQVDNTWVERDYAPAIMYLVAHKLVMEGVPGAPGGAGGGGMGPVKSKSIGDASVSYGGATAGGGGYSTTEELRGTSYGQSYLRLLRQNQTGAVII